MTITEESSNDLYEGLAEALGKQRANTLMEHLPPGGWDRMATKQDLRELRSDLRADMAELRSEMDVRFAELRSEMASQFAGVRVQFADLRTELHKTLRVHMLAMVAVMLTAVGIVSRLPG